MRRSLLSASVLVLAGCWGNPVSQSAECAAWVSCIRATDADAGQTTDLDRFEEAGFCWNNPTLGKGCTTACARAWVRTKECSR